MHMTWFRVHEGPTCKWVEGMIVCDECLLKAVQALSIRRNDRRHSGLVTSPVRVELL